MSESEFALVLKTPNVTRAELLKAILEGEGIPCMLENEHQGGFTGVVPVRLFVRKEDEELALEIIANQDEEE